MILAGWGEKSSTEVILRICRENNFLPGELALKVLEEVFVEAFSYGNES